MLYLSTGSSAAPSGPLVLADPTCPETVMTEEWTPGGAAGAAPGRNRPGAEVTAGRPRPVAGHGEGCRVPAQTKEEFYVRRLFDDDVPVFVDATKYVRQDAPYPLSAKKALKATCGVRTDNEVLAFSLGQAGRAGADRRHRRRHRVTERVVECSVSVNRLISTMPENR